MLTFILWIYKEPVAARAREKKSLLVGGETVFDFFMGGTEIEKIVVSTKILGAGFVEGPWMEVTVGIFSQRYTED
jgi:hypothetical protein